MIEPSRCCQVTRESKLSALEDHPVVVMRSREDFDTSFIPGGKALRGTTQPQIADDGEGPLRIARVKPFYMAVTTVTNAQFADFIRVTGYVTEAERFGWSFVFWSDVSPDEQSTRAVPGLNWWRAVDGADWQHINGPKSPPGTWKPDHPVVQVSWADACAYAKWVGGRLPTEVEWEHAARGGLGDVKYPWGDDDPQDDTDFHCNIWQGDFPKTNTAQDGFRHTAPARSFDPNGFGLYNLVGNVWEWTSDPFTIKSLKKQVKSRLAQMQGYRLSKGGSLLCHKSYCFRYRIAARSGTSPDSATPHQGIRIVWDV